MRGVPTLHLCFAIGLISVGTYGEVALTPPMNSYTEERVNNDTLPLCKFKVWDESKRFFYVQYHESNPAFVKFRLRIIGTSVVESSHADVVLPHHWFWTYSTERSKYPYLRWFIDFGIVSFSLLDARTLELKYLAVESVPDKNSLQCKVIFGDNRSMGNVVAALSEEVSNTWSNDEQRFQQQFFCYVTVFPDFNTSTAYLAGQYFNFPTNIFAYSCCVFEYVYSNGTYSEPECNQKQNKWTMCTIGPYIVGIIILIFFPLFGFNILGGMSKSEIIQPHDYERLIDISATVSRDRLDDDKWVFLDGKPPLSLSDLPSRMVSGFRQNHPFMFSRMRRLFCMLSVPVLLSARIIMYKDGIGSINTITVGDLVSNGKPLGFLSLLANAEDARKTFVPILGGPIPVICIYCILGIIITVIPRSLKQIVENGIPTKRQWSPLFFGLDEILCMAELEPETEPGYYRAAALCKGSFLMLFNGLFWRRLFFYQKVRFMQLYRNKLMFFTLVIPFVIFCFVEIVFCFIFNAVPLFNGGGIIIKGFVVSIMEQRKFYPGSRLLSSKCVLVLICVICFIVFTLFAYVASLIFLDIFIFISQITIMCFVAAVVFPSSSFGYIFFFVAILYYLCRLIRQFGNAYLELLSIAVGKCVVLDARDNSVAQGYEVSSINMSVNDASTVERIPITNKSKTIRQKGIFHGIPRNLYEYVIRKHRPIYFQVLLLLFKITLIITLSVVTLYILNTFNVVSASERSDVMHVVFVVTVGALPRVLEVVFIDASDIIKRQVEEAKIEKSIVRFWNCQTNVDI